MWIVECGIKLDGQTGYGARGVLARSCCLVSNYKIVYISFASDQVTYKQILNVKTLKFMLYADDILLVSHSLRDLQAMLDLCAKEAADLDFTFNGKKFVVLRIGPRYNMHVFH